jgi:uncharacterized MnhB-related membrane protein
MIVLQLGVLILIALAGTAMALAYEPKRQVMVSGVLGGLLALFFFVFQAPDVALSQLVVGAVAYPLMVLLALARAQGVDEPPRVAAGGGGEEAEETSGQARPFDRLREDRSLRSSDHRPGEPEAPR